MSASESLAVPLDESAGGRVLRRPMRMPAIRDQVQLLRCGWRETARRGVYARGDARAWWRNVVDVEVMR